MPKLLFTGAAGFLGRNTIPRLAQAGYSVTGLVRRQVSVPGCSDLIQADLTDPKFTAPEFDFVVHGASNLSENPNDWQEVFRDNVLGTANLLRWAAAMKPKRIIYISSTRVYGQITDPLLTEASPPQNPNIYGVSKLVAEQLVLRNQAAVPSLAFRLPGILGKSGNAVWVNNLAEKLRSGKPIQLSNSMHPFNAAVDPAEVACLLLHALGEAAPPTDCFNFGCSNPMAPADFVAAMAAQIGVSANIEIDASLPKGFEISTQHLRQSFGYQPISVLELIKRFNPNEAK